MKYIKEIGEGKKESVGKEVEGCTRK